jgi:hypothetical protein
MKRRRRRRRAVRRSRWFRSDGFGLIQHLFCLAHGWVAFVLSCMAQLRHLVDDGRHMVHELDL